MSNNNVRIVSLIPSATEILATLGLANAIVGRSHECDYPPDIQHLPVCTEARINTDMPSNEIHDKVNNLLQSALSIYKIRTDILQQLQPTHILTQDQCDVCAVSLQQVEQAVANFIPASPKIISLQPNVLGDVWTDIERVGHIFDVDTVKVLENLEARVKICQQKTQGLSLTELPKVACIEWTEPLMTGANWIPELVNLAGGQAVFGVPGEPSVRLAWDTLIASNPDVIVFMPCGLDLSRTRQETEILTQRSEWQKLHANQAGRVYITDGNSYFNRPGPRLVDSLEILAEILHPDIFDYGYKGTAWEPL
jgi:iron complex transport system substrate-binding protein